MLAMAELGYEASTLEKSGIFLRFKKFMSGKKTVKKAGFGPRWCGVAPGVYQQLLAGFGPRWCGVAPGVYQQLLAGFGPRWCGVAPGVYQQLLADQRSALCSACVCSDILMEMHRECLSPLPAERASKTESHK